MKERQKDFVNSCQFFFSKKTNERNLYIIHIQFQLKHDALLYPQSLVESNKPKTTEFVNLAIEKGNFFLFFNSTKDTVEKMKMEF